MNKPYIKKDKAKAGSKLQGRHRFDKAYKAYLLSKKMAKAPSIKDFE